MKTVLIPKGTVMHKFKNEDVKRIKTKCDCRFTLTGNYQNFEFVTVLWQFDELLVPSSRIVKGALVQELSS